MEPGTQQTRCLVMANNDQFDKFEFDRESIILSVILIYKACAHLNVVISVVMKIEHPVQL